MRAMEETEQMPHSPLAAQISLNYPNAFKSSNTLTEEPQISAESAVLVKMGAPIPNQTNEQGEERIIFKKKEKQKMAIASLTKLMTGLIALEFYQPDLKTNISERAVSQPEQTGFLKTGERLTVNNLLYTALIESSNDAAFALAEIIEEKAFVDLMNLKAKDMGLQNTRFFNASGIDAGEFNTNYSTAEDVIKLAKYVWLKKPLILEILSKKEYPLYLGKGKLHHIIYNTNTLLKEDPKVISGKTGFTSMAGECLFLLFEGKKAGDYYMAVVLNSKNRFEDMRKLIEYAHTHK